MPEVDFATARVRRSPFAERLAKEGHAVRLAPGRPKKGQPSEPTLTKSVRFSKAIWTELEQAAASQNVPLHAALRAAAMAWLEEVKARLVHRPELAKARGTGERGPGTKNRRLG